MSNNDDKQDAATFHRNIEPITNVLRNLLPDGDCHVLEIGSGSGQHTASLAGEFSHLTFWPSDPETGNHASIKAWAGHYEHPNVRDPIALDVSDKDWFGKNPAEKFAVILCFNVIHISPWETTTGLFRGAARHLEAQGQLILYGPYRVKGEHTADSNREFEKWLKQKDERFAVRDISDVARVALQNGLVLRSFNEVPVNNFMPVFGRI